MHGDFSTITLINQSLFVEVVREYFKNLYLYGDDCDCGGYYGYWNESLLGCDVSYYDDVCCFYAWNHSSLMICLMMKTVIYG